MTIAIEGVQTLPDAGSCSRRSRSIACFLLSQPEEQEHCMFPSTATEGAGSEARRSRAERKFPAPGMMGEGYPIGAMRARCNRASIALTGSPGGRSDARRFQSLAAAHVACSLCCSRRGRDAKRSGKIPGPKHGAQWLLSICRRTDILKGTTGQSWSCVLY